MGGGLLHSETVWLGKDERSFNIWLQSAKLQVKQFLKAIPGGSRRLRPANFQDNRHMKVVRLLALRFGRL